MNLVAIKSADGYHALPRLPFLIRLRLNLSVSNWTVISSNLKQRSFSTALRRAAYSKKNLLDSENKLSAKHQTVGDQWAISLNSTNYQ
jgi:hypothetical protein